MSHRLTVHRGAVADLEALPEEVRRRMWERLRQVALNPRGGVPLTGPLRGMRRVRVGDYRAAYIVEGDTVRVLAVGHRNSFYKDLLRRRLA